MTISISDFFVDVSDLPSTTYGFIQICFLTFIYGYILYIATYLIAEGSALLMLVPEMQGKIIMEVNLCGFSHSIVSLCL